MKKFLALMLVIAIAAAFTACGGSTEPESTTNAEITTGPEIVSEADPGDGQVAGGYTIKDTAAVELPEEVKEAFDLALADYTGIGLTPIAYLGSQVVAGTNYAVLCLGKVLNPTAQPSLKVAVIYKDLQGNASIIRVNDFNLADYAGTNDETTDNGDADTSEVPTIGGVAGGWTLNKDYPEAVLDDGEKAACAVFEGVMGAHYEPIACLATQVVAGINYVVLTKVTVPAADDAVELRIVTVYSGVDGSLDVIGTKTVDLASIAG